MIWLILMEMVTLFKNQINLFLLALAFFTRIPIPAKTPYSTELLNKSSRYYALVGLIIGILLSVILALSALLLPTNIAVVLTIVASFIITGAFHEDGFADMCDGFGGGFTPEKKLEIMKDSRVGTYGSLALISIFALMYVSITYLLSISFLDASIAILVGHTISRALSGSLIYDLSYLRVLDNQAKAKPLSTGIHLLELSILLFTGLGICLLLSPIGAFLSITLTITVRIIFKKYLIQHLGGFTGDCLGAAQIVNLLAIWLLLCCLSFNEISWVNPYIEELLWAIKL
jgi:adenosylcobinamide-GDP ribazoletransferase